MKRLLVVFAACACALGVFADASPIYLKADATGKGDGSSWENAFTSFADALADALAAAKRLGGDVELRIAGGLYPISSLQAISVPGLRIYGGFPGASEDETLSDRDADAYQTILCGDQTLDDVWVHVEPDIGKYRLIETETKEPVIKNGRFNPPPAYTGVYDAYCPSFTGTATAMAISVRAGGGAEFDGLWFVGFKNTSSSAAIYINSGCAATSISNCRFYACGTTLGAIGNYDTSKTKPVTGCRFRYLRMVTTDGAYTTGVISKGCLPLSDCSFESNVGGNLLKLPYPSDAALYLTRVSVTRQLSITADSTAEGGGDWGYGAVLGHQEANGYVCYACTFTNNYSTSNIDTSYGSPVFNFDNGRMEHCLVAGNYCETYPKSGGSYSLLGCPRKNGTVWIDSCVVRDNTIAAPSARSASGTAMLAVIGAGPGIPYHSILMNSTFSNNNVTVGSDVTLTVLKATASGRFNPSTSSNDSSGQVVFHNTFLGSQTDDGYEIMNGGSTLFTRKPYLINNIFMDAFHDVARPLFSSVNGITTLIDNTVQGMDDPPAGTTWSHLSTVKIPMEPADAFPGHYRPAVRMGMIDTATYIATNSSSSLCYVYRDANGNRVNMTDFRYGMNGWGKPISDAHDVARVDGHYRRGCLQDLSPDAETKCALVISCYPAKGGSVDVPAQNVATGEVARAVTAIPADGCRFEGWYDGNGDLVAADNPLDGFAVSEDTELVAKFATPKVSLTFDLGPYGTFEGGGNTATVEIGSGESFPEIPDHMIFDGYVAYGWNPGLPAVVPDEDVTYAVQAVTKDVRVRYVVPEGEAAGKKDGSSWADATDDFRAAYENAGIYRGEVWVKKGVYRTGADAIALKANVTVRGGFAGNESTAEEADPNANVTVISGDANGNDKWLSPSGSDLGAVWADGAYNAPNPGGTERYVVTGNTGDNRANAFYSGDGSAVATNSQFCGLVFSGYKTAVFYLSLASGSRNYGELLKDCRFVANGGKAIATASIGFTARGCEFEGNAEAISASSASVKLDGCRFAENSQSSYSGCIYQNGGSLDIRNTHFVSNCAYGGGWRASSCLTWLGSPSTVLSNCTFRANRSYAGGYGCLCNDGTPTVFICDCFFVDNMNEIPASPEYSGASACLSRMSGSLRVKNTSFLRNSNVIPANVTAAVGSSDIWGGVAAVAGGLAQFENCAFLDGVLSSSVSASTTGRNAGMLVFGGASKAALVNCEVAGSAISGDKVGEVVNASSSANSNLALVNTVVTGSEDGYEAVKVVNSATVVPSVDGCVLTGFDKSDYALGANDWIRTVLSSAVEIDPRGVEMDNGRVFRRVKGPDNRIGCRVWFASDGYYYVYDKNANSAKPWRRIADKTYYAAAISGLSTDDAMLADATCALRHKRNVEIGPVNPDKNGLMLILK